MIVLLVMTWVVDLLWMIYWIPHWASEEMQNVQKGLHDFVVFCSFVNFVMKLAVIVMLWLTQRDMLRKQVDQIQSSIKSQGIAGVITGAAVRHAQQMP